MAQRNKTEMKTNKKKSLEGKVIIVTGSSRGIGKATAIECCKRGARVLLNARSRYKLASTWYELRRMGFNVEQYAGDVTRLNHCRGMVDHCIDVFGKIDVLINNGSSSMEDNFEDLDAKTYRDVFLSNSYGAALPTLVALPYLKKSKGSIVFISSIAAFGGAPKASAYCASKMSLTGLAQSLRMELNWCGVHVGICHVSFTKNDTDKMVLDGSGGVKKVGKRPAFLQQPQEKVARSIVRMVEKRQVRKVLSPIGKIIAFMGVRFPRFTEWMMVRAETRKQIKIRVNAAHALFLDKKQPNAA